MGWAAAVILSLGLALADLPAALARLAVPCSGACPDAALTPASAQALAAYGITPAQFAIAWASMYAAAALPWLGASVLIIALRPADRVALAVAIFLALFGPGLFISGVTEAAQHGPAWYLLEHTVFVIGNLMLGLVFAIFPDGRFVPRWSPALVAGYGLLELIDHLVPPLSALLERTPLLLPALYLLAYGGMLYAQVARYRRVATLAQRQQTKWAVYGLGIFIAMLLGVVGLQAFAPGFYGPGSAGAFAIQPFFLLAFTAIPIGLGIAVLRYRLWDIDLLINRTLVYLALSALVIGLYVGLVAYLGALLRAESSLATSLVATGVVAVLFQPLRQRLQHGVNRLLYGERDEPYVVIARLGQRLEAIIEPEAALPAIVETVAAALKLPYAAIALLQDGLFAIVAEAGDREATVAAMPSFSSPSLLVSLPLTYQGETVGELRLAPRSGDEGFSPADMRLLELLAQQAGAAAHATLLAHDLRQARARLVDAREEERRRLHRDLHDGLGPQLASAGLLIAAARSLLPRDPAAVGDVLVQLASQTQAAVADVRRLVHDLRPPALDELGLVAALREHTAALGQDGLRIAVEAPPALPRLPAAVEVAAYRIVMEAVTNVARHARARRCTVRITCAGELAVSIRDDGQGLAPAARAGVGLRSMRERAAELNGSCAIGPAPGGGTLVEVRLPLRDADRSHHPGADRA
jgi:signal transduction histidine kinase